MSELLFTILLLVAFFGMLSFGVWVGFSLLISGVVAIFLFTDKSLAYEMATAVWASSRNWELVALPLFIWMGEILFRSRLSDDMFTGLAPWLAKLPGRLMHVNVFGCAIFAAVSGSSAATAATIGKMSIQELNKRGYPESLTIGTLAGSATLGLLIPPSIILIVYGVTTNESIERLFIAGILPGILIVSIFVAYIIIWSLINRSKMPDDTDLDNLSFGNKVKSSRNLIPVILLITGVMGSMFFGIASPTDAASVGVVCSLIICWVNGSLNKNMFVDSLMGATITSCMIAFILIGAFFFTVAMGYAGVPRLLAEWITSLGLSSYALLAVLTIFFIIVGCFLDGISVVVLTTSVIMPMVESQGIDPLWFGIYLVIVVEMSQITPPVGFNLFVIQGLTGKHMFEIAASAFPFFLLLVLSVVIITVFPEIVTFLPNLRNG